MADSNITKRALAAAMKELMTQKPFSKISIANICDKCDMNRKSFYYHFKDKYDLMNWIFDMDVIPLAQEIDELMSWDAIEVLCNYFYENRVFYRNALSVQGQNSFSDHFHELLLPLIANRIGEILGEDEVTDFQVNFFADACTLALKRWLLDRECISPEELIINLKSCVKYISLRVQESDELL